MAERAPIYSVISALRPGSTGPGSVIKTRPACGKCGQPYRHEVQRLELLLDDWLPCDLCAVDDVYAVTPRLREAMDAIGAKGGRFQPMAVGRSRIFEMTDPEEEVELPELVQLSIDAVVDGPSGWWTREGSCSRCGRPLWTGGEAAGKALASSARKPQGPPRQISRDAWQKQDLFWTIDPGPPLITDRLRIALERHEMPQLILHPAKFV